jgi:hypothetical protein
VRIFIDDSGSFSWSPPGISLFCGLTVADRDKEALEDRWIRWKRSVVGRNKAELKGSTLTDKQLESFSYKVFPFNNRNCWLTLVGADTSITKEANVRRYGQQSADILSACSKIMRAKYKNKPLAQGYLEMSGWARKRSPENILWLFSLSGAICDSLQHSIARFLEPKDDSEFNNIEIVIDKSFIRREQHLVFWQHWLTQRMRNDASILSVPGEWRQRDHPFNCYSEDGICNLTPVFRDHMGFKESHEHIGLQIADICANIALRYFRGNHRLLAFWNLRHRIVGRDGRLMTVLHITDSCFHSDDPENHVHEFDIDEFKARGQAVIKARRAVSNAFLSKNKKQES